MKSLVAATVHSDSITKTTWLDGGGRAVCVCECVCVCVGGGGGEGVVWRDAVNVITLVGCKFLGEKA